MSMTRLGQYEEPFIFSNRLVKFVLGMKPNQNANHMLLKWCILAIYLLPIIVIQMQQLFNYAKRDYQQYSGSKELCIFEKYTRQIKLRIIIFVSFFTLYGISLLIPSIFNALLHILGLLDDIHLTLPFPMMQLSTILQNTRETVECFIIIFGSIVTIFIILYTGQTLINHSIAVYEELCQIPFYMLSIKSQKLLLFLIARSVKPCEISIGGIFVASNETFSSIIQKAFSFATVYYNKL
ncbi:hypothetical protein M0802_011815 [Mischocyttarus mexicanus]|nr:hypothetical protein M0802_011815 [Mischocyttarus mexicanus]